MPATASRSGSTSSTIPRSDQRTDPTALTSSPVNSRRILQCVSLSCTAPVTSGSRTGRSRRSSRPPMRSSASRRAASADRTCGPTGESNRWTSRGGWDTSTPASSSRSDPRSPLLSPGSSWSDRSSPPTTPARSAAPATTPPASIVRPPPRTAPRPSGCGSRWPTAPWSPPPISRPTTWSRACWPRPMCWAPAGSAPSPPRPARARRWPWSGTARSGCSASWRPSSSARNGSSP